MVPASPAEALGRHASDVRDLVVEVILSRHERAAEAHQVAGTRYSLGFGSQWRDLLDDAYEALTSRGFEARRLPPAGYLLPVVNECLVFVWRVPDNADAVSRFAVSDTRRNGFLVPLPQPTLFDLSDGEDIESSSDIPERLDLVVRAAGDPMPLVLVMVHSSPYQLRSIEWAIAVLDGEGEVKLHGLESIWEREHEVGHAAPEIESFDSGKPVTPSVEPRKQDRPLSDA